VWCQRVAAAFWPSPVAGLIAAYQARLELQTRAVNRPADGFSWASPVHRPDPPPDQGRPPPPSPPGGWPHPGYPRPQGYVSPEGAGAQVAAPPYPPPRGYASGNGAYQPAGNPRPYRAGAPAAVLALPATMITAVRLMYAGAAYTLV